MPWQKGDTIAKYGRRITERLVLSIAYSVYSQRSASVGIHRYVVVLRKTAQYEHVLWICTNDTRHCRYRYFMSIMFFVLYINVFITDLLCQTVLMTTFN